MSTHDWTSHGELGDPDLAGADAALRRAAARTRRKACGGRAKGGGVQGRKDHLGEAGSGVPGATAKYRWRRDMRAIEVTFRSHERTTPDGRVADGARIAIRLDSTHMDLRNLAARALSPPIVEPVRWRAACPQQPTPDRFRAIMREHGARRRFHGHTRRLLHSVTRRPEAVGRRTELDQIAGSIELTISAFVYKRTRINDEFQEYRIMKRLSIFRVQRSR